MTLTLLLPVIAHAHCDTLDGPVVEAGRKALAEKNLNYALIWVQPEEEHALRSSFETALRERANDPEKADQSFFEALVRLHRQGEGEEYTGLKPAGSGNDPIIPLVDAAVASGSADELVARLNQALAKRFHHDIAKLHRLAEFDPGDVEQGRHYVEAYVGFLHDVENLHNVMHGGSEHR